MTRSAQELERRERQLAALYDLCRVTPMLERDRLFTIVVERVTGALEAHTASLLLRERGTDTLRMVASVGLAADVDQSVTLLVGERIAGRVAATRQPLLVDNDPRHHPMLQEGVGDIAQRPEVQSALCAPLLGTTDAEALGVLCVSRHAPAHGFTESDLRILALFAAQLGAVIAQAQVVEDLTRAAEERAAIERELARSAHLASLGQLAAMVAHELRNPLGSIKGAAQYLLIEAGESETARDFLSIVVEEVDGLGRLTSDLLEFARPSPPNRERRDLCELVEQQAEFLRAELAVLGATEVTVESTLRTAPVDIDGDQISRALRNLLLNAAQAIASVASSRIDAGIKVTIGSTPTAYFVRVDDSGPGLPATLSERVFEPFFTTKARGSGLGLAQVKRDIEAHGGAITAGDAPGGGARFQFELPRADQ